MKRKNWKNALTGILKGIAGGVCLVLVFAVAPNPALAGNGTISGYVYNENGSVPIANEGVGANAADGSWIQWEDTTGGLGQYTLTVPFGDYNICAATHMDTRYIREYYNEKINRRNADIVSVTALDPNITGINFTLEEAKASISGTVFDHNGVGEESVDLQYDSKKYTMYKQTASGTDGAYEFQYLAPALAQVHAQPHVDTGYAQKSRWAYLGEEESLTGFDFRLEEGALLDGIITMAHDGSRVNGAEIEARGGHFYKGWVQSDENGYYGMHLVPARYELTVNRGSSSEDFIVLPHYITVDDINDNKTVDMALYRVPQDCVTANGNIAMNAEAEEESMVVVMSLNAGTLDSLKPGDMTPFSISDFGNEAVSCEYSLPLVPDHTYDLVFAVAKRSDETFDPSHTIINIARDVEAGDVSFGGPSFSFDHAGGEITGRATDAYGEPVLMAEVQIFTADGETIVGGAETDHNGVYHIYNVPAGEYVVYGDHQDYWVEEAIKGASVTEGGVETGVDVIFGGKKLLLWNRLGSEYEVTHSETGPDGFASGVTYGPCKYGNGFKPSGDRNYVEFENNLVQGKGAIEFWWKPECDWDYEITKKSVFVDSQSSNNPPADSWGLWFAYTHHRGEFSIAHSVRDAQGNDYSVGGNFTPITTWAANDLIHLAMVWDEEGQIEGQYSLALYVNGVLQHGFTEDLGVPAEGYIFSQLRIGSSHFNYSVDSNIQGYADNIKIWNYAKTDFSDRFDEGQLMLWNKLGSDYEVAHSEVGPNGEIVGELSYEPGKDDNGFRSLPRPDPNLIDNYITFPLDLSDQGTIEFWYQPDWIDYIDHNVILLSFGSPSTQEYALHVSYNNWQGTFGGAVYDFDAPRQRGKVVSPTAGYGWTNTEPFHIMLTWDTSRQDIVKLYFNGEEVGWPQDNGDRPTYEWPFSGPSYLYLGSNIASANYWQHPWEGNQDGVIDEIKIWNYAKTPLFNHPPVADDITVTTDEDTPVDITLTATDPDGDSLTYTIDDFPSHGTASLDEDVVTYTPELNYNGEDSFTYKANDGELDSNVATVSITVTPVDDPPVLAFIGDKEVNEAEFLEFTLDVTEVDGDALTYSASNLPEGASFDPATRTFSWIPTYEQAGVYENIGFEVKDITPAGLADTEDITIMVNNVNRSPIAVVSAEPTNGKSISLRVNFSSAGSYDPDGDAITYLWDFKDGHTSTEPDPRHRFMKSGNFEVTLTVTDAHGATGVATVLIEVYNREPRAFAFVFPRNVREGRLVHFIGFALDLDGMIEEYEWSSNIDGILSDQPRFSTTELSQGRHTISFRVRDNYGDWSRMIRRMVMVR